MAQAEPDFSIQNERRRLLVDATMSAWYEQMGKLPLKVQKKVLKLGGKIQKLAG